MGQHVFNGTFNLLVQADFNALMGFVSASIQADGWTKTADTGQTNPATSALPAGDAATVFELFKCDDGLTPFYLKLSYQRAAGNSCPQFGVQYGTGTNGTGGLTGQTSAAKAALPDGNITNPKSIFVSGGPGRLFICTSPEQGNGTGIFIYVERSHDGVGANTSDYFTTATCASGVALVSQAVHFAGVQPPEQLGVRAAVPSPNGGTGTWQIDTGVQIAFPIPIIRGGGAQPMIGIVVHNSAFADFAIGTQTNQISAYGVAHNYIITGKPNATSNGQTRVMGLYE